MARKGRRDRGLIQRKGKWFVRLFHNGSERQFGSFPDKVLARDFYHKAKLEQKAGKFFPERYQRGCYDLAEDILTAYSAQTSGKTSKTIKEEKRFQKWWKIRLKGKRLSHITPGVLEDSIGELRAKGKASQTIIHYMKFLRQVLAWAIKHKKLTENPFKEIKLPKLGKGRTRFLELEEEEQLLEALGPKHGAWARFALITGLRRAEQFGLKWADVDLDRGLLTLQTTKSGDCQHVHLCQEAKDLLESWIPGNTSIWVFPSKKPDSPLDPQNFYGRIFRPAVIKVGLQDVTWHTLRHTFASRLAMSGKTESTIAALLRHSGTGLVARYAHLNPGHLANSVEDVAQFGSKAGTGTKTRTSHGEEV